LCCLLFRPAAGAPAIGERFLVFAVGYQEKEPVVHDLLALGYAELLPDGKASVSRYAFNALDNLKPRVLAGHVPHMAAPYGPKNCVNRAFLAPSPGAFIQQIGRWSLLDGVLVISFAGHTFRWKTDQSVPGALKLSDAIDDRGNASKQAVGFAFPTDRLDHRARLEMGNMAGFYDGDIFHKNMGKTARDTWEAARSGLRTSVFKAQPSDPDLYDFSSSGNPKVLERYKSDMWQHNSLLLNRDPRSGLFLYQDYGHDFDRNGCYDEPGHTKMLLAVPGPDQRIRLLVYVEYTYDGNDGYPMLSVGRYYAPPDAGKTSPGQ
jgi:hypothetical protein